MLYQSDENDQNRTVNKNVTLGGVFETPTPFSLKRLPWDMKCFFMMMGQCSCSVLLKCDDNLMRITWIIAWDAKSFNPKYLGNWLNRPPFIPSIDSTHQILQNVWKWKSSTLGPKPRTSSDGMASARWRKASARIHSPLVVRAEGARIPRSGIGAPVRREIADFWMAESWAISSASVHYSSLNSRPNLRRGNVRKVSVATVMNILSL
jgi:hypothetical protein